MEIEIIHGSIPWKGLIPFKAETPVTHATRAEIDKCLSCTKERCDLCTGRTRVNNSVDLAEFDRLYTRGYTPKQIAAAMGISFGGALYRYNQRQRGCKQRYNAICAEG